MTTTASRATTTILDVRCKAPVCGTSGQGRLLFRISADRKTLYVVCGKGHQQAIDVDTLEIVR